MEQQIIKTINPIKYVSKKRVTISVIHRFLKKISSTTFNETSLGKIICEMQQNGKIDSKFKIINPIYNDKNFAEDPLKIQPKTCNNKSYIPEESVDTASINSNNDKAKPIKVLPMNILILIIQIKLQLIVKLL